MRFAKLLSVFSFLIIGIGAEYYAPRASASGLDIGWNLGLAHCGSLSAGQDATVVAHDASAGSDSTGPNVGITVSEGAASKLRWASTFNALHIGEEFTIRSSVYQVTSIFVTAPKPSATYPLGTIGRCVQNDSYATVREENKKLPAPYENGIVLPSYLSIGAGPCGLAVSVVSLEGEDGKALSVKLEWHEYNAYGGSMDACAKSIGTSGSLREMDVLNLPGYGAFRVLSILRRTKKHADWVVLVPVSDATQRNG